MRNLIIIFSLLFICSVANAEVAKEDISKDQLQKLLVIKHNMQSVNELVEAGFIAQESAKEVKEFYKQKALLVINKPIPQSQLSELLFSISMADFEDQGFVDKYFGWVKLRWIVLIGSVLFLAIGIGWLCRLYLTEFLRMVPRIGWELLAYAAAAGCIYLGFVITGAWENFFILIGCIGFFLSIMLTHEMHEDSIEEWYDKHKINPVSFNAAILFLVWGAIAVLHENSVVAFGSIMAFQTMLGFAAWMTPLTYYIGFREESVIPRTMIISAVLIAFYSAVRITGWNLPYFHVFETGVLFLGTFAYFVGGIIISSKWYVREMESNYALNQLPILIPGIGAMVIGLLYQIPQLNEIGGTFFVLYLLEKYCEIPFSKAKAWWITGLGGVLAALYWVMTRFPEYILFVS